MAFTRVQSGTGGTSNASASSFTISGLTALTAGNFLALAFNSGSNTASSIPTSSGLIESGRSQSVNGTGPSNVIIFWYRIVTGGATSITFSSATGTSQNMCGVVAEYSAFNPMPDVSQTSSGNSGSFSTGTTGTTNFANELWVGALGGRGTFASVQTSWASAPTNSFAIVGQTSTDVNTSNSDRSIALVEKIVTTTGTAACAVTATSAQWAGAIITLRQIIPGSAGVYGG